MTGRRGWVTLNEVSRYGLLVTWLALGCGGDQGIERPTPLFSESPVEYPLELWDQDVEGSTIVRVLVNREGGVDSVAVLESSGHAALDSAALHGARSMEFAPARRAGEPLKVWARVPVHFSKSGEAPAKEPSDETPDTVAAALWSESDGGMTDPGARLETALTMAPEPDVTSGLAERNMQWGRHETPVAPVIHPDVTSGLAEINIWRAGDGVGIWRNGDGAAIWRGGGATVVARRGGAGIARATRRQR